MIIANVHIKMQAHRISKSEVRSEGIVMQLDLGTCSSVSCKKSEAEKANGTIANADTGIEIHISKNGGLSASSMSLPCPQWGFEPSDERNHD
jgi:hypothetical protein